MDAQSVTGQARRVNNYEYTHPVVSVVRPLSESSLLIDCYQESILLWKGLQNNKKVWDQSRDGALQHNLARKQNTKSFFLNDRLTEIS